MSTMSKSMRLMAKDKILGPCLDELNISDLDLQKGTDLLLMHMCIKGERERERERERDLPNLKVLMPSVTYL